MKVLKCTRSRSIRFGEPLPRVTKRVRGKKDNTRRSLPKDREKEKDSKAVRVVDEVSVETDHSKQADHGRTAIRSCRWRRTLDYRMNLACPIYPHTSKRGVSLIDATLILTWEFSRQEKENHLPASLWRSASWLRCLKI
ncbi:hypothetical protein LY78DRAFT_363381 [Colletotrichum sublineola]|nr:hypothetical protein LY78DRAFT_363381 [Colletotrichum sublineola]